MDQTLLNLLSLCKENSWPSIEEVFEYAAYYSLDRGVLHPALIRLLEQGLLSPHGHIDADTFLPAAFRISPAGEQVLDSHSSEIAPLDVTQLSNHSWRDVNRQMVHSTLPRIGALDQSSIRRLSQVYLHTAGTLVSDSEFNPEALYFGAARGFSRLHDAGSFLIAVRECLEWMQHQGCFIELALTARDFVDLYPECERAVCAAASVAISGPYYDLLGHIVPAIHSTDHLVECIGHLATAAVQLGKSYSLVDLDSKALIRLTNRVDDVLTNAFQLRSHDLYLSAIDILQQLVLLVRSAVRVDPDAAEFEARSGFHARSLAAEAGLQAMATLSRLVYLPADEREIAKNGVIATAHILARASLSPFWACCSDHRSNENSKAHWVVMLTEYPDRKVRADLMQQIEPLVQMLHTTPQHRTRQLVHDLVIQDQLQQQLAMLLELSKSIKDDTTAMRYVALPHVAHQLVGLFTLVARNTEWLIDICRIVYESNELLQSLDEVLADELPNLRRDVEAAIDAIEVADRLDESDRKRFLEELGKIARFSSAGKIVASIPLIPGFLTYSIECGAALDWNKWLTLLRQIMPRSPANQ